MNYYHGSQNSWYLLWGRKEGRGLDSWRALARRASGSWHPLLLDLGRCTFVFVLQ